MTIDIALAAAFTDGTGVVRGARASGNPAGTDGHFRFKDGSIHTIHDYGGTGNEHAGVYIPERFSDVKLVGTTVVATDPDTGETIAAHHINVKSQTQLDRNRKTTNAEGSKFIGNMSKGGGGEGYIHAHLEIFSKGQKDEAFAWKYFDKNETPREWARPSLEPEKRKKWLGDFRNVAIQHGAH